MPGRDAKALGLHTAGWHRLAALLPGRTVQRHPRDIQAALCAPFPAARGNPWPPLLPSSLAPGLVCSKAGHVTPTSWVSGVRALPLCAQGLGMILLPGVVNCSALSLSLSQVCLNRSALAPPSPLLLSPEPWKLDPLFVGCVFQGLVVEPLLVAFPSVPTSSSLAGPPCLFLLAWVKGPSVCLAICLVSRRGLGAVCRGRGGSGKRCLQC